MIELTTNEILALNSLIDDKVPFGLSIRSNVDEEKRSASALETLTEKGVLKKQKEITKFGMLVLQVIKDYKQAKNHIMMHRQRLCICDNHVIIFTIQEKTIKLELVHKHQYLLGLIKQMDGFKEEERVYHVNEYQQRVSLEAIEQEIEEGVVEHWMVMDLYHNKQKKGSYLYGWDGEDLFEYNRLTKIKSRLDITSFGKRWMEVLDIKQEGNEHDSRYH